MNKILRYILAVLFIGLGLYFLLPLVIGVRHIGMFAPAAVFGRRIMIFSLRAAR